jgi:DNA-binding transcriptional LysR family regulator
LFGKVPFCKTVLQMAQLLAEQYRDLTQHAEVHSSSKMLLMSKLSLDDLKLFSRVAAQLSLTAVARERNVAVSQVSRGLQRMEAEYGAQLVLRSTHGLSLTPEGETLNRHALRIVAELDELDAAMSQSKSEVSGLVRVGMSSVLAQHFLVDSLPGLHNQYPLLRLDFRVNDSLVDIARESLDLAIRTGEPTSDTLVMRRLGTLARRVYASPDYLRRAGLPNQPEDLKQHALIANSQHAHLNDWLFKDPGNGQSSLIHAQGDFSSDNTATMASMALSGLGIARIVSVIAEPLVKEGRLVQVLEDFTGEPPLAISAFMLAGKHRLPKIRACLDYWAHWFSAQG